MKIFYVANARIPTEKAHGIQIMKMCEAFARLGHEVRLIVPRRESHIAHEAFSFYRMPKTFEIVYLPSVDLISWSGWVPKVFAFLQNYTFVRSVRNYLENNKADLIYTRDELTADSLDPGPPIILEIHNISGILRNKDGKLAEKIKKFVVITGGLKNELVKCGYDEQKIQVHPDGVDLEEFKISENKSRQELGLPEGKKIIMYTGHLYEWKGAGVLLGAAGWLSLRGGSRSNPVDSEIAAAPSGPRNDSDLIFVFVGGTESEIAKFRKEATSLNNVLILGHKPHAEIPKYLAAADVLVLPNSGKSAISRYYTSPLKMFEYMASGKPIVASDLPSIREVLNEFNAVLVSPDEPRAWANGVRKVLDDPQLARRISETALRNVQNYTWSKRAANIIR